MIRQCHNPLEPGTLKDDPHVRLRKPVFDRRGEAIELIVDQNPEWIVRVGLEWERASESPRARTGPEDAIWENHPDPQPGGQRIAQRVKETVRQLHGYLTYLGDQSQDGSMPADLRHPVEIDMKVTT